MEPNLFRELAMAEMDAVYRMAFHLARRPDDAADLVQETYLRALKAEHTFELRDRGIRPWLFKILHNVFYSRLKREQRAPAANDTLDQTAESSGGAPGDDLPSWDLASLDWEMIDDRLKHAIENLPVHYRVVLLLWAVEGLKYREIADVLDVALGTVMSRLYRARAILAVQLADLAQEQGIGTARADASAETGDLESDA